MWILPLVGYVGILVGFGFLTLAIASGLYYLSELVEEHTVFAKRLLTQLIYSIIGLQILLAVVDRFPLTLTAMSIGSHVVYMQNLRRFPIVKLSSPVFISSCVLVLVNHYLWFRHFSSPPTPSPRYSGRYNYETDPNIPSFTEVASYFGLCVWLVPFALFVGLSAGENVLPSMGSEYATGEGSSFISAGAEPGKGRGRREGLAKQAIDGAREWFDGTGQVLGLWKGDKARPL
ncbi:hypothetical protein LTS18_005044 [Coniosporium uncinatum]|uniref:Uncharacterized protein n=1 Tax=Coniosporium uncinatum TaxID=93489 RepID=A0ACC3D5D4_9PEZI|nr:hypothetical protein LTS18_005044 [Coniosporium uncinatum]